jgi:cysteine-rich repeat protein
MRRFLLFAACLCVARAFDVEKFRRDTPISQAAKPRPREWDDAFRRFLKPLGHPNFLPLCGNGILNTKADYTALYGNGQELLNISNRVPGVFVKISADEVCDDGNRLDGDGCSADCMDTDLFQSVCEVASDDLIEAMTLDQSSGDVYVSTSKVVGRVEVGLRGIFTNWNAIKSFTVDAMAVNGSNIFMYSSSTTTLYKVEKLGMKAVQFVKKFDLVPGERGDFIRNGDTLLLFVKDAHRISVMDVVNSSMIAVFKTTEFIPPTANIYELNGRLEAHLIEKFFSMKLDGSDLKFENATAGSGSTVPFWDHFAYAWVRGVSKFDFQTTDATVERFIRNETHHGMFQTVNQNDYHFDPYLSLTNVLLMNPMILGTKGSGLRTILVSKSSSISYGKYPDEFYATGRPIMLKTVLDSKYECNDAETCFMDIPLGFDLMRQSTYNSVGATYYDVLKDVLTPFKGNLSTTPEREPLAFQFLKSVNLLVGPKIPRTAITIPKTLATWFLRDGVIFHLNKRGVVIEDDHGRCVPADIMPCNNCQWATSEHMCQPCSVASPTVAWQVQCKLCGSASRRLLGAALIPVTVTIGNSSDLLRIFGGTVINSSIVTVMSTDPAATLRNMSSEILKHPEWIVLDAPQAVYSLPDAPPPKTTTTKNIQSDETAKFPTEIVLAAALGVLVGLLAMWGCLRNNQRTDGYSALGPSDHAQMIINVPIEKFN